MEGRLSNKSLLRREMLHIFLNIQKWEMLHVLISAGSVCLEMITCIPQET